MSPAEGSGGEAEQRSRRLRFRIAFFLTSLGAITVRALMYVHDQAGMDFLRGRRP